MQNLLDEAQQAFDDGTLHQYLAAKFILASTAIKLSIGAIAALFLVFLFSDLHTMTGPGPDQAAKEFMQALADRNSAQMVNLTCDAQKQQLDNRMTVPWAVSFGQSFLGTHVKIDVSQLNYTVVSNDGTYAIVHIQGPMASSGFDLFGSLYVALFGGPSNIDINEPMLHEHDRWVICD
jgi:hypothetical protein